MAVIENTIAMNIAIPPKKETGYECCFLAEGKSKIFLEYENLTNKGMQKNGTINEIIEVKKTKIIFIFYTPSKAY
jgi:hypothetical protein